MDGYFEHRDKIVTVYDSKTVCGKELVKSDKLITNKIPTLIDYESDEPIWPHEPYAREYLIVNKDSLLLTFQGYR